MKPLAGGSASEIEAAAADMAAAASALVFIERELARMMTQKVHIMGLSPPCDNHIAYQGDAASKQVPTVAIASTAEAIAFTSSSHARTTQPCVQHKQGYLLVFYSTPGHNQ